MYAGRLLSIYMTDPKPIEINGKTMIASGRIWIRPRFTKALVQPFVNSFEVMDDGDFFPFFFSSATAKEGGGARKGSTGSMPKEFKMKNTLKIKQENKNVIAAVAGGEGEKFIILICTRQTQAQNRSFFRTAKGSSLDNSGHFLLPLVRYSDLKKRKR